MKKRLLAILMIVVGLASCDVAKEVEGAYNIIKCEYSYKSISDLSIAGINTSNGISPLDIPKILLILSGSSSSIPLEFTLNLDVKNPNQTPALLHGLEYAISIDGILFTEGRVEQSLNIEPGGSQILPLRIGFDLATLMNGNSRDAVVEITKNFIGIGSKPSNVMVQLKPTFMIGNMPVTSPTYIPVSFSFGGK